MARRKPRRRRTEVEEIEDIEDEDQEIDDELEDEDEDDEEPEPAPKRASRRSRRKTAPEPEEDEDDEPEEDGDEDDEEPAPRRRSRRTEEAKAEIQEADANFFAGLIDALDEGKALVMSKLEDGRMVVTVQDAAVTSTGRAKKVKRPLSDEYKEFQATWKGMTPKQKYAYAKKLKAEWAKHENEAIDLMRMGMAVLEAEGISKYVVEDNDE